jgi:(4-O-methyl)-D-glucuronate---lignin esterase
MKSSFHRHKSFAASLIIGCAVVTAYAQPKEANYDESKIPAYTLPDPLVLTNGQPVTKAKTWQRKRRPEILKSFETQVYGRHPGHPWVVWGEVTSTDTRALGGKATRKEVSLFFNSRREGPQMDLLIYLPAGGQGPFPAFFGLNFNGNHAIANDPGITLARSWMRNDPARGIVNNRATDQSRGSEASRWAVEKILARGYAVATICYGDIEPDFPEGWKLGVRGAFSPKGTNTVFAPDDWGAISAWAWGLSYAMDYLERDESIDAKRVALIGHSRLGKTALWAGAQDERFAIVISNNSGEGGAALARRNIGETVERINTSFPHWFCGNFKQYNQDVNALPVDQHMLLALIAPRPLYVASAEEDKWADPHGEFLAARAADPVYQLLGKEGLGADAMPKLNEPAGQTIGYHIRTGKHDVTDYDWEQYLNFADRHFR